MRLVYNIIHVMLALKTLAGTVSLWKNTCTHCIFMGKHLHALYLYGKTLADSVPSWKNTCRQCIFMEKHLQTVYVYGKTLADSVSLWIVVLQ
jgi:hypothetical protein